ncbi:hypothetical protein GCM10029992_11800 [Glycomyces albus]
MDAHAQRRVGGVAGGGREALVVGQGDGGAASGGADAVEAGVDDDAVQPGGDRRVAFEGAGGLVGLDHGVLDGLGGVLGVGQGAHGHGPQSSAVAAEQLTEGVPVAGDVAGEQVAVGRLGGEPRWAGRGAAGMVPTGRRL